MKTRVFQVLLVKTGDDKNKINSSKVGFFFSKAKVTGIITQC